MKKYAVIVAGGKGLRMKAPVPKQFLPICGIPVLMHTLRRFYETDPLIELILVLPPKQLAYWRKLCNTHLFTVRHRVVSGGKTRFHSVKKGLALVKKDSLVAVHDGVRPLVSKKTIGKVFAATSKYGNAVPVIPVQESLRITDHKGNTATDRSRFRLVQTPQCFSASILKKSYALPFNKSFTDDASVIETAGYKIHLVEGNPENIKITTPADLHYAEALLQQKKSANNIRSSFFS